MAFVHFTLAAHAFSGSRSRPRILRRLIAAMIQSRAQQAEHEIERFFARRGGKFSDEVEREIERHFLANPRW